MQDKISYQSANVIPVKVIYDKKLVNSLHNKKVIPRVFQITPTNACDLNCVYCCCGEIDRKEKLSIEQLKEITDIAVKVGVKAFVITGGGEPMVHPNILEFIDYAHSKNIKLALITNGNHFKDDMIETLSKLQWCRISFDDYRKIDEKYRNTLSVVKKIKNVNFSFSYMYDGNPDSDFLKIINIANSFDNISHVRIVNDSLSEKYIDTMTAKEKLDKNNIDTSKCFFKYQQQYGAGQKKCYMSLLKPRIVASGDVYPCCAIQYQEKNGLKKYNKVFSMGHYSDIPNMIENQRFFNGNICNQCYYENYNKFLGYYLEPEKITDKEFI